jgi:nitroimidazol reductase NimA-like FMN-containing flavoprotein (pyridoxamine 5'-phosphate oxidase superfamily)
MVGEDNPITVLDRETSWALLRGERFGRLAVSVADHPDIFPVNFYADEDGILIRTAQGTKLLEVTINGAVAFEVDHHDEHGAWSVVLTGTARVLERADEIDAADELPLRTWIPTLKLVYVRITPTSVEGRRFRFGPEPTLDLY